MAAAAAAVVVAHSDTLLTVQFVSVPSLVDSIKCVLIVCRLHSLCTLERKKMC